MICIKVISETEASGDLQLQYNKLMTPDGVVDNSFKIHSLNPPSLQGRYAFYRNLMYGKSSHVFTEDES